jgi:hypothetical protein
MPPAPGPIPAELAARRDRLRHEYADLQSDLGGLVYEMAIRDSYRVDVITRRAAKLQAVDAQLTEVERAITALNQPPATPAPPPVPTPATPAAAPAPAPAPPAGPAAYPPPPSPTAPAPAPAPPAASACPACGKPVTPGTAFCGSCGTPLGSAAPPTGSQSAGI